MTRWWEDPRVRTRRIGASAFAVVLLVAGVVVWWQQPWAQVAAGGEVVALASVSTLPGGEEQADRLRETVVELPIGSLTLRTVGAMDTLDATDLADEDRLADYDRELTAPRGTAFVPVLWDDVDLSGGPGLDHDDREAALRDAEPTLELVDGDGARVAGPYDLVTPQAEDGGASPALALTADDPDEVRARITFDGVAQVVDLATGSIDAGLAAPLYDDPAGEAEDPGSPAADCTAETEAPAGFDLDPDLVVCTATVTRTPWLSGTGWVEEPGQVWLTAEVIVTAPYEPTTAPSRPSRRFPLVTETWSVAARGAASITYDGAEPDLQDRPRSDAPQVEARWERVSWLTGSDVGGATDAELVVDLPVALVPTYDDRPRYPAAVTATVDAS